MRSVASRLLQISSVDGEFLVRPAKRKVKQVVSACFLLVARMGQRAAGGGTHRHARHEWQNGRHIQLRRHTNGALALAISSSLPSCPNT
jgi:hypothetical protein